MEGVFRPMLKKWRIWLPILAVLWFWTLIWQQNVAPIRGTGARMAESFGCLVLYHNAGDKKTAQSSMWSSPMSYDCWETTRTWVFRAVNIVPGLVAAVMLDFSDRLGWDEVIVGFVSLSSSLILFWWFVGALIDGCFRKPGTP